MKGLFKTLVAVGMSIAMVTGIANSSFAAVCPGAQSPNGVHNFCDHKTMGGHMVDLGTHQYLYGYDANGLPIYHNDCKIQRAKIHCYYVCTYCGLELAGSAHEHDGAISHSVSHKL